jgi:hypothetical protein
MCLVISDVAGYSNESCHQRHRHAEGVSSVRSPSGCGVRLHASTQKKEPDSVVAPVREKVVLATADHEEIRLSPVTTNREGVRVGSGRWISPQW